ncbi:hypothetical protein JB92DRAFT_3119345 [Gautieria morchelliformis]|nr:hypothetical protein JB92DRAFT_3119345 [Gautieria morchelliformis]
MATLADSKKKAQRGKKAHQHPSYADLLAEHLQTEKRNQGRKESETTVAVLNSTTQSRLGRRGSPRDLNESMSESESETKSKSESDDEGGRSHRHRHRSKKKKTLIPKPFGTSGKKVTGERGSKGYNLKDHMGLSDSPDHSLDIRVTHHHRLTGKKRKQDVKALALICIDVEKKFPELKHDYSKNKVIQRPKKAAQGRARREARQEVANKENEIPSDNEEHGNAAEDGGDSDKRTTMEARRENPFEGVHQEEDDDEESDVIDPRSQIFEEAPESQTQRGSIIHHYKIHIPARNQDTQNKKKSPPPVATSTHPQLSSSSLR